MGKGKRPIHEAPDKMTPFSSVPPETDPETIAERREEDDKWRGDFMIDHAGDMDSTPEHNKEEAA
ncbi:hypothetical protein EXS54_02755 [Patescibacteria group bacterium]|nr:hypothetical protein [Patescibacteria group bacterium]